MADATGTVVATGTAAIPTATAVTGTAATPTATVTMDPRSKSGPSASASEDSAAGSPAVTGRTGLAHRGPCRTFDYFHSRTSTKWPAIAAAAAITGETRCVRPL